VVAQVIERDRQAVGLALTTAPSRATPRDATRVIAIASGKGGVGKTNLAANLGIALSRRGKRVLLFDADFGLANVDVLLGLQPERTLRDVVSGRCQLGEVVIEAAHGLRVVPGGCGLRELVDLDGFRRGRLLRQLADIEADYDFVLVDAAAGVGADVTSFVSAVGEAIVVTTPEPTSLTDAYALVKVTLSQAPGTRFAVVVNSARGATEGAAAASRLQAVAQRFLGASLPLWGILPFCDEVPRAVRRQVPTLTAYPECSFSLALEQLGRRLLGQEERVLGERPLLSRALQVFHQNRNARRH